MASQNDNLTRGYCKESKPTVNNCDVASNAYEENEIFLFALLQAIINIYRPIIKFGLAHLMATNMGTWIVTVVIEGALGDLEKNKTTHIFEGNVQPQIYS